jgi:hypothetical protein
MKDATPGDFRPKSDLDKTDMALAYRADYLAKAFQGRLPTAAELKNITEELGIEVATAVFLKTVQDSNTHGPFAREVRSFDFKGWDTLASKAAAIEVAVVASNLFQSGRKWGDHVDEYRTWARDLGFTTDVIETDPRRSVASNARVIFEYLARSPTRPRIILTYGQGSAEFRYMLHRRVNRDPSEMLPEEIENVRGWLSICGAFSGASSSRHIQENRISRLLARLRMKVAGRNPVALAETSSNFPLWRMPLPLPPKLSIASIVGVPYRAQVPLGINVLYDEIAKSSPNDGCVSVIEASAHPGLLMPVQGLHHRAPASMLEPYFKRTLAVLSRAIVVGPELTSDQGQQKI